MLPSTCKQTHDDDIRWSITRKIPFRRALPKTANDPKRVISQTVSIQKYFDLPSRPLIRPLLKIFLIHNLIEQSYHRSVQKVHKFSKDFDNNMFLWTSRIFGSTIQVWKQIYFVHLCLSQLAISQLYLSLLLNLFIYRNTKGENNTPPPPSLSYFPILSAVGGRPRPPAGPIRWVLMWLCCLSVSHCSQIGRRAAAPPNTQTPHTEDANTSPDSTYNVITWRMGHLSNGWTVSLSSFL